MSRIARKPIEIPKGVEFNINAERQINVKGKNGQLSYTYHKEVLVEHNGNLITVKASAEKHPMVGTTCKLIRNMIEGVHQGFLVKLVLVGVGYRAKLQGNTVELSLGFSHPVVFPIPKGISIEVPSNTEILVKGIDREVVGKTAADIRSFREPERYKGKGVRYADEVVILKEVKKK